MVLKAEINVFHFQPAGVAPVEHRAPSEGGGRQQAGQADALQVGDDTDFSVTKQVIQTDALWQLRDGLSDLLVLSCPQCPLSRFHSGHLHTMKHSGIETFKRDAIILGVLAIVKKMVG